MAASHGHHDVFWAPSAGTPMSRLAGVPEACAYLDETLELGAALRQGVVAKRDDVLLFY